MIVPQHGHDAQAQAGGVAAHQIRGLQQQLCLHHTQLIQQLDSTQENVKIKGGMCE